MRTCDDGGQRQPPTYANGDPLPTIPRSFKLHLKQVTFHLGKVERMLRTAGLGDQLEVVDSNVGLEG